MTLPMPFSPAASWAVYKDKLRNVFQGADPRVMTAFWLFGLINNVLYVIILTAALDLVGTSTPKGAVLLFDVIPSFLTKLTAPYYIHSIPYPVRIFIFVALSTVGMLLIALSPQDQSPSTISIKMSGVVLASLSSGGGELSFLGLTHYYGHFSLAAWGSGTGGAGLVGAGLYALATDAWGWSVKTALLVSAFMPVIMLASFFVLLPRDPLKLWKGEDGGYKRVEEGPDDDAADDTFGEREGQGLLSDSVVSTSGRSFMSLSGSSARSQRSKAAEDILSNFKSNLKRARGLFIPYMLPLLLVYIAEYTINQGVAPTLLFPLKSSPFSAFRSFYPTYNAIYQVGVFVSRSSTPFLRVHHLYYPSFLQVANLLLLTAHAIWDFIPSVWIVFAIVFWEGLLGGLVYVNTFAEITDNVPREDREFSLGATTVSDSAGICIAGFLSMGVEVALCGYQVRHGRDYCKRT
ncbi:protein btn1 [Pseudovirgaria hyperparasitica]|uniref:Protein BTN n=1 Tax=Pseudovirgaria hyperparasitica TaxID=470096 RepID=A0A6A6WJ68_9PEZI|nr:protein btn1 [Pseudovirgaria hyperparasitica]KAF2762180.1 protein btn1 [Pseudovirgaria hyperparasitica]